MIFYTLSGKAVFVCFRNLHNGLAATEMTVGMKKGESGL